jgi:hypothetical protein
MSYRIFSRKAYRREGGKYVPSASRGTTIRRGVETVEEARRMCASGPANVALREGREYRNLPFHEFTEE